MRILGPVVLTPPLFVVGRKPEFGFRSPVRAQLVGDDLLRREALLLE